MDDLKDLPGDVARRRFLSRASWGIGFSGIGGCDWLLPGLVRAADMVIDSDLTKLLGIGKPDVLTARPSSSLRRQFVVDHQTFFAKSGRDVPSQLRGRLEAAISASSEYAQEKAYTFEGYLKAVFLDSDTRIAVLTSFPGKDQEVLSNEEIWTTCDALNRAAGEPRLLPQMTVHPEDFGWLAEADPLLSERPPAGWRARIDVSAGRGAAGYWRIDDQRMMYPFYEKCLKKGVRNFAITMNFPMHDPGRPQIGAIPPEQFDHLTNAAHDWPQMNFIITRGATVVGGDSGDQLSVFELSGYIPYTTDLTNAIHKRGVRNVYVDLSTIFATVAIDSPRYCAAIVGHLVNALGGDHVLWATGSVLYGPPQWCIEAMRRLEIPDDMMKRQGWKTRLGDPDGPIKRQIFGANAAGLYGLKVH